MIADELEALELGDDRRHHEGEHTLPGELARSRGRGCLQLRVLDHEAHLAQLLGENVARPGRVVRDEAHARARHAATRCTASAAPGIASPETWRTPSMSSRMSAMERESIRVTRSVSLPSERDRDQGLAVERARRPARPEVVDARRGRVRRRVVQRALGRAEAPRPLARGAGRASGRAGRAKPAPEPRARYRAPRREASRRPRGAPRRRVPTTPSAKARERRLEAKRRRARTKAPPEASGRRIDSRDGRAAVRSRCSRSYRRSGRGCSTTSAACAARSGRSRRSSPTRSPTT